MGLFSLIFGSDNSRSIKKLKKIADKVIELEDEYKNKENFFLNGLNLKEEDDPKEYYCLGCVNSNSKHLSFCEIKKCAESKKNASCAFCKSFPCSRLDNISSETLEHLKELRKDGE